MERDTTWRSIARCKDSSPDLFFRSDGMTDKVWDMTKQVAREFCSDCPANTDCLETAILHNEHHGIWGGEDFSSRRVRARYRSQRNRLKV